MMMAFPEWPGSTPEERAALFDAHALADPSSIGPIVRVVRAHTDRLLAEARAAAWEEGYSYRAGRGHSQIDPHGVRVGLDNPYRPTS